MNRSPTFFEPLSSFGKKYYLVFWLTAGIASCVFVWSFGQPLLDDQILNAAMVNAAMVLALLFAFFAPVCFVFLQRRLYSLLLALVDNATSQGQDSAWSEPLCQRFQFSHSTNIFLAIVVALAATGVGLVVANALGLDPLDGQYLPFWIGGLLGFTLGGAAAVGSLRLSQTIASLPNSAFRLGFQKKSNKLLGSMQTLLLQASIGVSVLWLIQLGALMVAGVLDNPATITWLLVSSAAPLGPTMLMFFRAHEVLLYLKEEDLSIVGAAVETALTTLSSGSADELERLNHLLELQERVAKSREWPGFGISFSALGVSSVAPLISVLGDLWSRLG